VIDALATDPHFAFAGGLETGNDAQKRSLAAAVGAEQHHELLVGYGHVDRVQRLKGPEVLGDVFDFDNGHFLQREP